MKHKVATTLIMFMVVQLIAQNTPVNLSLEDAVSKAILASPELRKLELTDMKNGFDLSAYNSAYLPQVSGQAQFNFNPVLPTQQIPDFIGGDLTKTVPVQFGTFQSHQATASVNQIIYSKALNMGRDVLKKSFELNAINQKMKKEDLTYNVAKLYFQIQGLQFQLKNVEANLENLNKLAQVSQARQDAGIGLGIDTDRIKINVNNLKSQREILVSQERSLMDILNILTGIQTGTPLRLTTTDVSEYESIAYLDADNIKTTTIDLLDKQKELMAVQIESSKVQNSPTLSAFAQAGGQLQGNKADIFFKSNNYAFFGAFGLQLSVPIYNGKKYQKQAKAIEIEMMQVEEDKNSVKQGLEQQYVNAFQTLFANKQQKQSQLENVELARKTYRITQDRYNQGVAPLIDVIDAQKSLTEAENMAMLNDLQIKLAQIEILNVQGNINNIIK